MNLKILFFVLCLFCKIYSSSADDESAMTDLDLNDLDDCKEICIKNFYLESGHFDKCYDCINDCDKKFGPFLLEIVSKQNEGLLFSVNIKWDEIIMNEFKQCLVTWEISGGGLMGNLVTDSPKVELTLWADKLYNVQVKCKNTETNTARSSYKLIVNTKPSLTVTSLETSKSKLSDDLLLNANENLENEENMSTPINFPSIDTDIFMDQEHKNETDESDMMEDYDFYMYIACVIFIIFIGLVFLSIMIYNIKQSIYANKFDTENTETIKFIVLKPIQVKHV